MNIEGAAVAKRDIEACITVTKSIVAGNADAVEQHGESRAVGQVAVKVAVEAAGHVKGHGQGGDLRPGAPVADASGVRPASEVAIWNSPSVGEAAVEGVGRGVAGAGNGQ